MIDFAGVFANLLWIVGLSVLLAAWSYAYYEAGIAQQKTLAKLQEFGYALVVDFGLLLFVAGMVATEDRWWARGVWGVGSLMVLFDMVQQVRQPRPPEDV